ncbi:hypothetical protein [Agromyces sp. CF514]|uniref:hypothetical protein n=1 Tax=Agromyces sp. CF514 TaxID=1881031 RepID=UPI0015A5D4F1|nr:hypothetical protein [Agromyces sp. CF514]
MSANPRVVKVSVSPFTTAFEDDSAAVHKQLPAETLSQIETCDTVSVVVIENAGEFVNATAPADGAPNVAA